MGAVMSSILAQFDLVKLKYSRQDARLEAFYSSVDYVNELAESHPGFIWREVDDNLLALSELWGEEYLYTLSLWRDVETFKNFLYETPHKEFMRRGREWFEPMKSRVVLWWVPEGHLPTIYEAHDRLKHLYERGPSYYAFDLKSSALPITGY
jgi:heme-degrading monooxygenase HmoA